MRRIEVDDQVYALLEGNGQDFELPNDVLRRLLQLDDGKSVPTTSPPAPSDYISGKLMLLINDGLIAPGDTLIHHQEHGDTHHAVVEADGWITTDVKRYTGPSAALTDLVGSRINGWANWVHVQSGKTLRQLRDEGDDGI